MSIIRIYNLSLTWSRYLETKALIPRAAIMKLIGSHATQPVSLVARSMLAGLFESCYAASVELEDIMARERRLMTFDGPPESHSAIGKFTFFPMKHFS